MMNGSETPPERKKGWASRIPWWIWPLFLAPFLLVWMARPILTLSLNGALEGSPAPDLSLTDIQGKEVRISDFKGKAVVLNFWASWCGPCVQEFPSFAELEARFQGRPFQILLVNVDEKYESVAKELPLATLPGKVLFGATTDQAAAYGLSALPLTVGIDPKGIVRIIRTGGYNWSDPELVQEVEALVPKP